MIMTKEQTLEAIKVMQAWCDGRKIQVRGKRDSGAIGWRQISTEWAYMSIHTDYVLWDWDANEYRIAPEPIEIEAWVHNETGRVLDTSVQVTPVGYTKRKFREVVE
jgi:hypothetical protein